MIFSQYIINTLSFTGDACARSNVTWWTKPARCIAIPSPNYLPPIDRMFRAPKRLEMAPVGDGRRYLWVMEPWKGKIYGKAFQISMLQLRRSAETPDAILAIESARAYKEMMARAEANTHRVPEGSLWEEFL